LLLPLGLLDQHHGRTKELGARFGILPLARRDVEHLRQILMIQRQLRDLDAPPRHKRSVMHRTSFAGALAWLQLHGNAPHMVTMWKALLAEHALDTGMPPPDAEPLRRRRRRRRRGRGPSVAPGGAT
jgi:hypothetical protein